MLPTKIKCHAPIVVTPDILRRLAWNTNNGVLRSVVSTDLYLNGSRACQGDNLDCGHIVVVTGKMKAGKRRCPLCKNAWQPGK